MATWMGLKCIMLSKISETKTLLYGSYRKRKSTYKPDLENQLMVAEGEGVGMKIKENV